MNDCCWLPCYLLQQNDVLLLPQNHNQRGKDGRGSGCGKSGGCRGGGPGHNEVILSPIQDVSPSLEAAEQESMHRMQVGQL